MKTYVAAKRCRFADVEYMIGDTIPMEVINPNRINDLLAFRVITTVDVPDPEPPKDETPPETTDSNTDNGGEEPAEPDQKKDEKAATAKKNRQGKAAK